MKNNNNNHSGERFKKFLNYPFALLAILLFLSLIRSISKIRLAQESIGNKEQRIEKLKKENEETEKRLEEVTSEAYIEKQLRDNLGLAKEGEIVVVLPDESTLRRLAPHYDKEEDALPEPNWKQWLNLFVN